MTDINLQQLTEIPKNSATKVLYIVRVKQDPNTVNKTPKFYATNKLDKNTNCLEFIGYEYHTDKDIDSLKSAASFDDAEKIAKEAGYKLQNLFIPWHMVLRIENATFEKSRKQTKQTK